MAVKRRSARKKAPVFSPRMREWIRAFIIALGLILIVKWFVFDLRSVADSSMEMTLMQGDVVVVNKYQYGARMPMRIFPQSWINILFSTDSLPPVKQLPYWRFPGNRAPELNDLVLINIPAPHEIAIDRRTEKVKRLVALPGDELTLAEGKLTVNGAIQPQPAGLQWGFVLETVRGVDIEELMSRYDWKEGRRYSGRDRYIFSFTHEMADSVRKMPEVRSLTRYKPQNDRDFESPFGATGQQWRPDQFGPLKIPYKGFTFRTTQRELLEQYFFLILYHERESARVINDSLFIDDEFRPAYTFRNNYYFVLGDNRHNTFDSRLYGLVPENHLIARVSMVLLSFDKEGQWLSRFRKDRFFRVMKEEW